MHTCKVLPLTPGARSPNASSRFFARPWLKQLPARLQADLRVEVDGLIGLQSHNSPLSRSRRLGHHWLRSISSTWDSAENEEDNLVLMGVAVGDDKEAPASRLQR